MILSILIIILFIIFGGWTLKTEISKRIKCKSITTGKVIDFYEDHNSKKTNLFPIFEYEVYGTKYTKQYNFGTVSGQYSIGQEVEIHYNPNNANDYYIKGNNSIIIFGVMFLFVGIFALIALFAI